VVLAIVAILVLQPVEGVPQRSREAVLKSDLQTMREAIDRYTLEKQSPPTSLHDLVNAHFLRIIPTDPMTHQRNWIVDFGDVSVSSGSMLSGIRDVHSGSTKTSLAGTPYNTW
jgi:general secretion pathway protein G